jgi:hypothetical protein
LILPDLGAAEPEHFEIFKEHLPVLEAFFILDGCAWNCSDMGVMIGLDYPAAKVIWDYAGIKLTPDVFRGVMAFSRTVADELNKKRKK